MQEWKLPLPRELFVSGWHAGGAEVAGAAGQPAGHDGGADAAADGPRGVQPEEPQQGVATFFPCIFHQQLFLDF